ncbi:putative ABC transport system permease protein [Quadrisphaera granulorum]|uniref:Putative ABC transport system permease protein n=1 Tax=Quadrisphaera granulorum TaxID=317664 RepID=A0A316AV73_9ACTN|nr:FtsX-like permease family protein [Quadrisphaera granulorum]PWJ53997.1 putative ABC transport system permease protein [Quadrisphaera granulorum]SZE96454.1 putative ABC transport system permease protein [Quadrisphaera granulorum]
MFVAWRDLRAARGRFALLAAVVALVTLLVGSLTGLTAGLAAQNVSAVLGLDADAVVLARPAGSSGSTSGALTFADSSVSSAQQSAWASAAGVTGAWPLGVSQTRATRQSSSGTASTQSAAVAVLGTDPGLTATTPASPATVVLSTPAAEALKARTGETVELGGQRFTVAQVSGDGWYSHTPVVWTTFLDWQQLSRATGGSGEASALLVRGDLDGDQRAALDTRTGTTATTLLGSLGAIGAFRSEVGSLGLIIGLLLVVSALVVGAFFTVWTLQRTADVAVLKALGASTRSLVVDALGQGTAVLVGGVAAGTAGVVAIGLAAGTAVPFVLSPLTALAPSLLVVVLGLVGVLVALRAIVSANPLTALGSIR